MQIERIRKRKRKIPVWLVLISIIILILFFVKKNYKTTNLGNTTNKTIEECTETILNMSSYQAKMEVTVQSNKNKNCYLITQEYNGPKFSKQVVEEPSNIKGLTTVLEDGKLKIENTKLNLTTIYEDYEYITENHLFLNYFIEDYKNGEKTQIEEKDQMIILKVTLKSQNNKYAIYKTLYLEKGTGKPIKLEVQDVNKNIKVYILYNEININSTNS